ncbi:MAG: nuclear transport factor 2 family protein [Bacteroidales bacterium]|nr:nuclear transport factor 2 family protein [Bacteroidales bacterium]
MFSCKPEVENTNVFTAEQKALVTNEIMEVSDKWVQNNIHKNPDSIVTFWSNSPDMYFAEDGVFFDNRETIHSFLTGFYENTDTMHVEWLERRINPISDEVASLAGKFRFRAKFKSGDVHEGKVAFTAVFTRENGAWSIINGHESAIPKE